MGYTFRFKLTHHLLISKPEPIYMEGVSISFTERVTNLVDSS